MARLTSNKNNLDSIRNQQSSGVGWVLEFQDKTTGLRGSE